MKLILAIASLFLLTVDAAKSEKKKGGCEIAKSVTLTFYGLGEASGAVAYSECGRTHAGGRGTFDSPLTMAAAPGAFGKCEVVFVPYLLKYVRFEDICTDCIKDWAKGRLNMQIWVGNEVSGGAEQTDCEKGLAPTHGMAIVRTPGNDYRIDSTPLYSKGATDPCRMDHRYSQLNNDVFCYGRTRDKTAGRKRKKPASAEKQRVIQVAEPEEEEVRQEEQPVMQKRAVLKPANGQMIGRDLPIIL